MSKHSSDKDKQSVKADTQNSANENCRVELEQAIDSRNFSLRFKPVLSFDTCRNFAYLARVSGAQESPIRNIDRLFAVASDTDCLPKLTKRYLEAILSTYSNHTERPLLLPFPSVAMNELGADAANLLAKVLRKTNVSAESIFIIHPGITLRESKVIANIEAFTQALMPLQVGLAATGFGCNLNENLLWSKYPPYIMLLDEGHLDDMDSANNRLDRLHSFIETEHARGRKLLVQSINGVEQFNLAKELGIDLLSGDFIGKPKNKPYDTLSASALNAIPKGCDACTTPLASGHTLLERLLIPQSPVEPDTSADTVFSLFEATPDLHSLAVVKDGTPLGIIARYEMVDNMSRPFRHELFGRKPCERFMDADPLIMNVQISTPDLMDQVIKAHPRHLISGFIVTDSHGQYLGMGAVQDLMREITNMQIQAARYANPLTQLPGNVAINTYLDNLLSNGTDCVVAYGDLDHFKPFNDVYGYAKGDEMILLTAHCMNEAINPELDFVGHIGGDDFVIIFRSPDWHERCQRVLDCFAEKVMTFFSAEDIAQGGYNTANRKGEMELHALASLSIGIVKAAPGQYDSHLSVATVAAEVKKHAKAIKGNSLFVDQRKR